MNSTYVMPSNLRDTPSVRPRKTARLKRPKVSGPRTSTRKAIRGFPPHFVPGGVVGAPLTLSQALQRLREAAVVLAGTAVVLAKTTGVASTVYGSAFMLSGQVIEDVDGILARRSAP